MSKSIREGLSICRAAQPDRGLGNFTSSLTTDFERCKGVHVRGFETRPDKRVLRPRIDLIKRSEVLGYFGKTGRAVPEGDIATILEELQGLLPKLWEPTTDTICFNQVKPDLDDRGRPYFMLIPDKDGRKILNRERHLLWHCLGRVTGIKKAAPQLSYDQFGMRIAAFTEEVCEGVPNRVLEAAVGHLGVGVETRLEPIHCHPDPNGMTAPSLQIIGAAERAEFSIQYRD